MIGCYKWKFITSRWPDKFVPVNKSIRPIRFGTSATNDTRYGRDQTTSTLIRTFARTSSRRDRSALPARDSWFWSRRQSPPNQTPNCETVTIHPSLCILHTHSIPIQSSALFTFHVCDTINTRLLLIWYISSQFAR